MINVEHYENGNIKKIEVRNEEGLFHNDNGPAEQSWYKNGQEKRRVYWIKDKTHNENGPAYQEWYENGQESSREYWLNRKLHNENGPARQIWHENGKEKCRVYFLNDELHNKNGPAYQKWYENGQEISREYWINDKELTEEEFNERKETIEVIANNKIVRISKQSAKELGLI